LCAFQCFFLNVVLAFSITRIQRMTAFAVNKTVPCTEDTAGVIIFFMDKYRPMAV